MIIKSIDIQNYRGIEKLHVDLHEGMNLFIGNNGSGKTSLLNAISTIMSYFFTIIDYSYVLPIKNNGRKTIEKIGDTVTQVTPHYPVDIYAKVVWEGRNYSCNIIKRSDISEDEVENYELPSALKERFTLTDAILPVFTIQRVGRVRIIDEPVKLPDKKTERIDGYKGVFSEMLAFREIAAWCLQMDFAEYQRKQKVREYETFGKIVSKFMSLMDEDAVNPRVLYSSELGNVVYDNGREATVIYLLSDGFQSVLSLIMELAYRTVMLNPNLTDEAELEGIVVIDEIDTHLHPAWQWKILGALRTVFPRVQFIVATHSPIVLSSAKDAALYLLRSPNEVEELESPYGYSVNDVLSYRQGSTDIPQEVKQYYDRLEECFDHGSAEDIKNVMAEAKAELGGESDAWKELEKYCQVHMWIEEA